MNHRTINRILIIVLLLFSTSLIGQVSNAKIDSSKNKSANGELLKQIEDKIKEERSNFEKSLDRYSEQTNKLLELNQQSFDTNTRIAMSIITGMFIVGVAIFIYFFGRRFSDLQNQIQQEYEKKSKEIINRKLEEAEKYIQLKIEKIDKLEKSLDELTNKYSEIYKYQKRKFLCFFPDGDMDSQSEIEVLHSFGIEDINVTDNLKDFEKNLLTSDVILFNFNASPKSTSILKKTVIKISSTDRQIFLIIYTYNNGNLVKVEDKELLQFLNKYKWYQMANYPMTLISIAKTLLK